VTATEPPAPLDPAAATAACLLASKALDDQGERTPAGDLGPAAVAGLDEVTGLVAHAAADDPDVQATLGEATARPDDPAAIAALAHLLGVLAGQDDTLQSALGQLATQAAYDPAVGELATTIGGQAQVGKVVTIGHAGTVNVHPTPVLPPTVLERLRRVADRGPLVANLPPRNSMFTGRQDLLERLHANLRPRQAAAVVQQAHALYGLGGVGKTQLALEYAHRHASDYDLIWRIVAEQPAAIPGQLAALARRLGIPEAAEQAETVQVLWDELRQRDRWLLIYDNAEDPQQLRPWLPPGGQGHVLITSHNPAWGGLAVTLPVDVLERAEGVALLGRRLGRDNSASSLTRLAAALGDLPLALEQAAAYLEETATPTAEYLTLLDTNAKELFALGRPATTEQTIATIWTVSLQRLRQQTPEAEDLLVLCAFLAPDDIPRSLPIQDPDVLPERLATTVRAPLAYQQAIGTLRRYSLVTTSQDDQALNVHRLVQAVTRQQLDGEQERQWATAALRLVSAAFPAEHTNPDAWPVYGRLLPHALAVTSQTDMPGIDQEAIGWLLNEAGLYLWQRADYQQARSLHERVLAIFEARLGADHAHTARSLSDLANVLRAQGYLDGAGRLHKRALAIREARLGADHPLTADSLNDVGNILYNQGDLDGARRLHERALAIREARLGADDPETGWSLNNLAVVLQAQGEFDAARTLHERALGIRQARLGDDHPHTAWSLNNLANVVRDQGDLDRARTLHERALAIRDTQLGADHPHTAISLHSLAVVLRDQGDLDAARRLLERALAIREARLGADHPDTVRSRQRLAEVVAALDKQ
jgi:tetratricopeptide (TPR) repeat protein